MENIEERQNKPAPVISKRRNAGQIRIGVRLPPLPPAPIEQRTITLKLSSLKKELPDVLSHGIERTKPVNIYQIESSKKDIGIGFNEIAWRDQDGSKLYLENLSRFGEISESLKVTYTEVKSLAKKSGWTNSLPDTIYVQSGGGSDERMAAKKMVLGCLDSYQNDPELQKQLGFKLPNKPILKETQTDNVGPEGLAIEFSVKNITQLEPIMMQDVYKQEILFDTKNAARFGLRNLSPMLGPINEALTAYQAKLQAGVEDGFRVEGVTTLEARAMFKEIMTAATDLKNAIESLDPTVLNKLKTLKTLKEQVDSAITDKFKNELDTRRWKLWLPDKPGTVKPLTEDVIVPGTRTKIGAGAQGPVFKCELDPALGRSPVVLKYDSSDLNGDARAAGLPQVNPQQSLRAVAAYKISEQLQLDVIPRTELFVGTDDDGRPKLGQAMDVVNGPVGQRRVGLKNQQVTPDQQKAYDHEDDVVNNPGKYPPDEFSMALSAVDSKVKVKDTWYAFEVFPAKIDYGNRFVHKGLSDLQVFDCIIGHADRNPANWIYETDENKNIIRVKGIDNDDTFGKNWAPSIARARGEWASKTPGIPPIVDISTALSILNANFEAIRPLLAGLSDEERAKAAERFAHVKQQVGQRVRDGAIASIGEDASGVQAKLDALNQLTGADLTQTLRWGNLGDADFQDEHNSYLGFVRAAKNNLAQKYPETEGVVPESGLV